MLKYMLDTNICIFTIKNKPQVVRETFLRHAEHMCISAITLMELIYGAEKSSSKVLWRGLGFWIMTKSPQNIPASFGQNLPERARPSDPTTR